MSNATDITITTNDGAFSAYLARPGGAKPHSPHPGPKPGVVVLQEIFGVNQVMRTICDELADAGFIALCPDLFWRIKPGIQITDKTEQEWQQAFELFGKFDVDKGVSDSAAAIAHLRELEGCSGKIGTIGYCLGGQLAYLTATRTDANAAVGFYGVNIQNLLGEAANIKKPLMLHIAGKDEFVPAQAQAQIIAGLKDNSRVTLHQYPARDHAFARKGGAHYDEADAAQANTRSLAFLKENLG